MDTREKIIGAADAARKLSPETRVVSGFFDPLLAWHAARLEEARAGAPALAVVIREPASPVLPARGRAELVAALRAVDWVIPDGAGAPAADIRLEEEDSARNAEFLAHLRLRQS